MQTAKALHRLRRDTRDKSWRTRDRTTEQDGIFVQTKSGMLHGLHKETLGIGVDVFFGVPFAKPPLGDLRFRKPVKIDPWPGIYNAHHLPNSCQQEVTNTFPGFRGEEMWNPNTNISEDCLYLNIWVPSKFRLKVYPLFTIFTCWYYHCIHSLLDERCGVDIQKAIKM